MSPVIVLGLFAQLGSDASPVTRLAVVSEAPLDVELRKELDGKPLAEEVAAFVKRGYGHVDRNGIALLFSPKLWAEKEIGDLPRLWQQTAQAVGADGTINLSGSPLLSEYLANAYGSMGFTDVGGANMMLNSMPTVTLTANGKTKTFSLGNGVTAEQRARLRERKLKAQDPKVTKALPSMRWLGQIIAPEGVCVYTPGPKSLDPIIRMNDIASASKILAERYDKAAEETRRARRAVAARFPNLDPLGAVRTGDGFSDLPEGVRQQLQDLVGIDYARMGFRDAGEASAWLVGARVQSTQTRYTVSAAVDDGAGGQAYRGVGLP